MPEKSSLTVDVLRRMLEALPDALVVSDTEGRIVLANAQTEKLFGYPRDELLGRSVEVLVPERFRGGHVAHRGGYLQAPHLRPMGRGQALYGRRKDGRDISVEISLSPLQTEGGL